MVEQKDGKKRITVSFECETLKAEDAAEDHIRKFMPKLAGMDAVGMSILKFCFNLSIFFTLLFYNSIGLAVSY
jgi:energy-converting hydrogenase Eha subunit H